MTQPTTVQAFDEDIRELVGVVDEACRSLGGTTLAKELTGGGDYNDSVWKTLGVDIGLAALGLPEELGGLGGLHEMVACAETVARSLLPIPLVATVLSTQVLSRCDPRAHEAVHSAVNGRSVVV